MCIKSLLSLGKYTSCCNIMFRAIAKHTAGQNIDKLIRTAESTDVYIKDQILSESR